MRKLLKKACSEAFRLRYTLNIAKNDKRISDNARCETTIVCVSCHEAINSKKNKTGRKLRVRIMVYLLFNCPIKKALSAVIIKLTILESNKFSVKKPFISDTTVFSFISSRMELCINKSENQTNATVSISKTAMGMVGTI